MGCLEAKSKNSPILICLFEAYREEQREFFDKIKESYRYKNTIKYQIKSTIDIFAIKLKINDKLYDICSTFISNSQEEIDKALNKIYDELDKYYKIIGKQASSDFYNSTEIQIEDNEEDYRLFEMNNKVLENQKYLREVNPNPNINYITDQQTNNKINNVLEDMCIFGAATKNKIKKEKIKHPEKFIDTNQALKMESQDQGLFALGLLSKNLEDLGIETAIEKNENLGEQNADLTGLQFLTNGLINKKKYDLHFEFGEQRNNELLNNKVEYEKFKQKLKLKLSKDYNIPPEKIIVTLPQKGSFRVQIIFQSEEFNNLDKNQFINKFRNDPDFDELKNLKEIHEDVIMGAVKLTRNQLDPAGNRNDGWGEGEQRGGKDYDPPIGWNGIGLKVTGKYDNGDDKWIGMCNGPGEWCVAYHGVGRGQNSNNVKQVTGKICKTTFKPGGAQAFEDEPDANHPGKLVGRGVYCTPLINTADDYAGISNINGTNYKTVLMVRVKPSAIRFSASQNDYWVVNGTTDEIRPYRILYKKC